jgi:hypothetical protein
MTGISENAVLAFCAALRIDIVAIATQAAIIGYCIGLIPQNKHVQMDVTHKSLARRPYVPLSLHNFVYTSREAEYIQPSKIYCVLIVFTAPLQLYTVFSLTNAAPQHLYKDYKGPTLWQTELREGFPEGIPIVSIGPLKTTFESQSHSRNQWLGHSCP